MGLADSNYILWLNRSDSHKAVGQGGFCLASRPPLGYPQGRTL